ncbi:DUF3102 domain-containing protein [Thermoleptolyngbya sp. M55_K2018_002]|uniref:DUF3102 domain-containing protein n=1 Tax=Thermoleptolyngbya sp. M55_K2018_002 TaxID=2747808 RepID=UPI0019F65367|nr:DUF3102 domain-containing protein [Thermoleptolyngbya sp. M55_K2018_002]HIK42132.1 DUF3102 domain-containing protein [Thermoleptolyngbya sp. M55_K2018_002]
MTSDDQIRSLYEQATEAEATALQAAKSAAALYFELGQALAERKQEIQHGAWIAYLEQIGIDKRKAQRAMQLAKRFEGKSDSLTHLSLTAALEQIQEKQEPEEKPESIGEGDESYSPHTLMDDVRRVIGEIDLDPASCPKANETVKAAIFYGKDEDGLSQPWSIVGKDQITVWDNAPYSFPLVQQFSDRLIAEWEAGGIRAAIAIRNNCTDAGWFQRLAAAATVRLDLRGRLEFCNPYKNYTGGNRQGQTLFYFGQNPERFYKVFAGRGLFYPPQPAPNDHRTAPNDQSAKLPPLVSTQVYKNLGSSLAEVQAQFGQNTSDSPATAAQEIHGVEAELHYAIRRVVRTNALDWDMERVDAIALHLTKTFEFYVRNSST